MKMQSPKLLLMDFYLKLLAIPATSRFRINNQGLYSQVLYALASELQTDMEEVQNIFERMASEDVK